MYSLFKSLLWTACATGNLQFSTNTFPSTIDSHPRRLTKKKISNIAHLCYEECSIDWTKTFIITMISSSLLSGETFVWFYDFPCFPRRWRFELRYFLWTPLKGMMFQVQLVIVTQLTWLSLLEMVFCSSHFGECYNSSFVPHHRLCGFDVTFSWSF